MKHTLLLLMALLFAQITMAYDLEKIRLDYIAAVNSSKNTEIFYKELKAIANPDALILAYLGSAQALRAKHAFNPINKLAYLNQGNKTLSFAVNAAPNNLEIRFLRFSLEHYIPTFLGYSINLESDRIKLIELLQQKNQPVKNNGVIKKNVINFLLQTKRCTSAESILLKQLLS